MNSECLEELYHDYQIVKQYKDGIVEQCTRCRHRMFFNNKTPNWFYLSHHLRSLIQLKDRRYNREYASSETTD